MAIDCTNFWTCWIYLDITIIHQEKREAERLRMDVLKFSYFLAILYLRKM